MNNLDNVLKIRDLTLPTKVHLVKVMVFPRVIYGCETWTKNKPEYFLVFIVSYFAYPGFFFSSKYCMPLGLSNSLLRTSFYSLFLCTPGISLAWINFCVSFLNTNAHGQMV